MRTDRLPSSSELDAPSAAPRFASPRIGSRYIQRTDLLKKLWRDRHAKLTLVTGSAGFGKTSLLAQWRQELMKHGDRVCWLSLTADEDSLASFAAHCMAALEQLGVSLDEDLLLIGEGFGQIDRVVTAIVNTLATRDDDLYLLIDDYHHIQDPKAHQFLQKLIDHNPGNLHITLASRATPPLGLARLRVMGQVTEIEYSELPFSLTDTRAFLGDSLGATRLSADQSMEIHDLTRGWPASLRLISIMLRNRPAGAVDWNELDWGSSDLYSYLTREVVGLLPPEIVALMEPLSLCRCFNASLARAITGREDADQLIERIEQDNLLLVRDESDDREPWFRFHPMLNDYLRARLALLTAETVHDFHRKAARWFDEHDMIAEAITHAAQGDDPAFAASVAQRVTPEMWRLSQMGALYRLVNALPLSVITPYPQLVYFCSITLAFVGAPTQAAALDSYFPDQPTDTDLFHRILLHSTIALRRDDTDRARALIDQLIVPKEATSFERHLLLGAQVIALAGAGRFDEAYDVIAPYEAQLGETDDGMTLLALDGRGMALLLQGRVAEARSAIQPLYERSTAQAARRSTSTDLLAVNLAYALFEMNRSDEARAMLAGRQRSIQRAFPQFLIFASLTEVRLEKRTSREAALTVIAAYLEKLRSFGLDRGVAHLLLLQLEIEIEEGTANAARTTVQQITEIAKRYTDAAGLFAEIPIICGCAQARLALFERRLDAATDAVEVARNIAARLDRGRWLVTLDLLSARIEDARGAPFEAQAYLDRALKRGESLGLIRTFLDEGEAVARLLEQADGSAATARYLETLRDHFGRERPTPALRPAAKNNEAPSSLSPREQEIIRLLAANMSNKMIASTIGISIETVKWNLKNIFLKLDVSSRYHAVTWARQHELID